VVTLEQPQKRSNVTTPSFTGTANESMPVKVFVFKGATATGTPLATLEAPVSGGAFKTAPTPALADGTYTAVAEEKSTVENPAGFSQERVFEITTKAPSVTLTPPPPPARSNNTKPSFTGTASETTPVTVLIYKGSTATGTPFTTVPATVIGGEWTSSAVTVALAEGKYTAVAQQESSLAGNPTGVSNAATFTIETHAPVVTIKAVPTPTNEAATTFQGTASDTSAVVVEVFAGAVASGTPVATATSGEPTAGNWTAKLATALPSGEVGHPPPTYTAIAREASPIGNGTGSSTTTTYVVNTLAPEVALTAPSSPSNNRSPTFSGTASDHEPVVVHVYTTGLLGERQEVSHAEGTPSGGSWKSGALSAPLAEGKTHYTAVATEKSSIAGNPEGQSNPEVAFVVDTTAPTVTIKPVATPSNILVPSFSGTATDTTEVHIVVSGGGKKFETKAPVVEEKWSSQAITLPSVRATYTAVVEQPSSLAGNPTGKSKTTFEVDPNSPTISMAPIKSRIDTATPTFSGTAGDNTAVTVAICPATATCAAGAGKWTAVSATGSAWTAVLTTPLEDGEYEAIASQKNADGDIGATEPQRFTIDTQAPAVSLSSPADGATVAAGSLLVAGTGGTDAHDLASVTVQLFAGSVISAGQTPLQSISVPISAGAWSVTLGGLIPGTFSVRALQSDQAGNLGVSAPHSFTVAGAAGPHGPTAAFSWFPAKPHVGESISLVSSSTDDASPITGYAWNVLGPAFVNGGQTRTTSFSTPGAHAIQLRVTDAGGRTSVASQSIPVSYPLMKPFPVVRIVTTRSLGRVRLKVLSVEAPVGVTVSVSCTGKGCPVRSQARLVPKPKAKGKAASLPTLAFPSFERSLPPGVSLVIRISHAGEIGKYTKFTIRRGKLPVRSDACVSSTDVKPVSCSP